MTTNYEAQLLAKAEARSAILGVICLGYVGLPLAVELAEAGYQVVGFDDSKRVVDGINAGRSHVQDIPTERLAKLVKAGKISATTDLGRLKEPDGIAICVPTPLSKTRDPDVSFIAAARDSVARAIRPGQVIILQSTTYPGTTREMLWSAASPRTSTIR